MNYADIFEALGRCGTAFMIYAQGMTLVEVFEWAGSILGLAGSYTLAFNIRISRYGWFVFLAANIAQGLFGFYGHHYGVLLQAIGFTGSSLMGVYRAFVAPPRQHRLPATPALRVVAPSRSVIVSTTARGTGLSL